MLMAKYRPAGPPPRQAIFIRHTLRFDLRRTVIVAPHGNNFKYEILCLNNYPVVRIVGVGNGRLALENAILTEIQDGYAILTLDRPDARNALNTGMLKQLAEALAQFDRDPEIRIVILTGADGNFASGADIGEIADKTAVDGVHDLRLHSWETIAKVRKPLIAAVEGYCLGGGFELAQRCDLIVTADNATFGQPEVRLGMASLAQAVFSALRQASANGGRCGWS